MNYMDEVLDSKSTGGYYREAISNSALVECHFSKEKLGVIA